MHRITLLLGLFIALMAACEVTSPVDSFPSFPTLGHHPTTPEVFAPYHISTAQVQRDLAVSPDSSLVLYTLATPDRSFTVIMEVRRTQEGWTSPQIASFSGKYTDLEPAFSPNGKWLYFSSNRPITGDSAKDVDIWRVARLATGWGTPENLGAQVNGPGDDFYPSVAANGNLYFTGSRPDALGQEDIYQAIWTDSGYATPSPLGTGVNSAGFEFNAFVAPDESYLIFTGYNRQGGLGSGDLYISFQEGAEWSQAISLVQAINSPVMDYCPTVWN
ncbi:MAG: hypothetical protein AAFQ98_18440, partial [Bacteroidota bacterium]